MSTCPNRTGDEPKAHDTKSVSWLPAEKVGDQPSPEWEGSVSAVADYELLMKGAGAMTDQQFNGAIHLFINRYEVQAIKEE